jgi:NAD(P)-dependent dehydrogenase (short-subunit alcohol dehydrogenase family)
MAIPQRRPQQRVLVTGANRGIGLEFARQLAARGDHVFATARDVNRATELRDLAKAYGDGHVTIVPLDVDSPDSIRSAAADTIRRQADGLDLLINNAGIYAARIGKDGQPAERFGELSFDDALKVIRTNAVAPLILTQALLPLLKKSRTPKVVSITSGYGSVSGNNGFPYYYAASKAALNQFMRSLAGDSAADGIITIVMSPGWVQTEMGGAGAPTLPEQSVAGMLKVIDGLTAADNSTFKEWRGKDVAW